MSTYNKNFPALMYSSDMREELLSNYASLAVGGADVTGNNNAATVSPIGTGAVEWQTKAGVSSSLSIYAGTLDQTATYGEFGPNIGIVLRSDVAIANSLSFILCETTGLSSQSYSYSIPRGWSGIEAGKWTVVWIPRAMFTALGTPAAAWCTTTSNPTFAAHRIYFALQPAADTLIEIAGIVNYTPAKAKIILTFDDQYDDPSTGSGIWTYMYPRMKARGWRGTVALRTDVMDDPGRCTLDQLLTMQSNGWDMLMHTGDGHVAGDDDVVAATWLPQFRIGKEYMMANGFARCADMAIYPGTTAWLDTLDGGDRAEDLFGAGFGFVARAAYGGKITATALSQQVNSYIPRDWMSIARFSLQDDDPTDYEAAAEAFVERTILHKGVGVLYTHSITDDADVGTIHISKGFADALLADLAAYEAAGQVEIITASDWYNEVHGFGKYTKSTTAPGTPTLLGSGGLLG